MYQKQKQKETDEHEEETVLFLDEKSISFVQILYLIFLCQILLHGSEVHDMMVWMANTVEAGGKKPKVCVGHISMLM